MKNNGVEKKAEKAEIVGLTEALGRVSDAFNLNYMQILGKLHIDPHLMRVQVLEKYLFVTEGQKANKDAKASLQPGKYANYLEKSIPRSQCKGIGDAPDCLDRAEGTGAYRLRLSVSTSVIFYLSEAVKSDGKKSWKDLVVCARKSGIDNALKPGRPPKVSGYKSPRLAHMH